MRLRDRPLPLLAARALVDEARIADSGVHGPRDERAFQFAGKVDAALKIREARLPDRRILRTQVPVRPEGAADRDRDARPRRPITNGGSVDGRGILDADLEDIEADRLDAVEEIEGSIGEGRDPNERACAVSHGQFSESRSREINPCRFPAQIEPGNCFCSAASHFCVSSANPAG